MGKVLDIKNVVQFGKGYGFKNYEKFRLHYFVATAKSPEGTPGFIAYALEIGLTTWAENPDDARKDLLSITKEFLSHSERSHEEIFNMLSNPFAEEYWAIYRQVCFLFGDPDHEKNKSLTIQNEELRQSKADLEEDFTMQRIEKFQLNEAFENMKKEYEAVKNQNAVVNGNT